MDRLKVRVGIIITVGVFLPLLFFLKTDTLFGGDAGDLVVAAFVRGVAHPPGYPLYTILAHILTKLPLGTIAGRVSYVSTIPALFSIPILFSAMYLTTKRFVASLIATCSFGFSYLFLLLAIIPEVFALHILFTVSLVFLLLLWQERKDNRFFSMWVFVFGLSLTHHHTILFMLPAFLYFISINRHLFPKKRYSQFSILNSLFFFLGLLPYSYVYFAAKSLPVINWENPQNLHGFIRLVTRAIYGSFQSGQVVAEDFALRRYQLVLFFETLVIDTTWAGILLASLGTIYSFIRNRKHFIFLFLAFFFTGPFFVYYASFPFNTNFFLGTIERFYLFAYVFFFCFIAWGFVAVSESVNRLFHLLLKKKRSYPIAVVFLLYPVLLLSANIPKLLPLKTDRTAEYLGRDVLATTTGDSIMLLTEDTRLFDTQYIYYTNPGDYDTRFIHFGLLWYPHYQAYVQHTYPGVPINTESDPVNFATRFIEEAGSRYTLYAEQPYPVGDAFKWIPVGIMYRLYSVNSELSASEYYEMNEALFSQYYNPLDGALGSYKHAMLADVLRVYGNGRRNVGKDLVALGMIDEALPYFEAAITLQPEALDNYLELMQVYHMKKQCEQAEIILQTIEDAFPFEPRVFGAGAILYRDCFMDDEKSARYEQIFQEKSQTDAPQLDQI